MYCWKCTCTTSCLGTSLFNEHQVELQNAICFCRPKCTMKTLLDQTQIKAARRFGRSGEYYVALHVSDVGSPGIWHNRSNFKDPRSDRTQHMTIIYDCLFPDLAKTGLILARIFLFFFRTNGLMALVSSRPEPRRFFGDPAWLARDNIWITFVWHHSWAVYLNLSRWAS